jgi:thiamine biosynthesis lipoprotein
MEPLKGRAGAEAGPAPGPAAAGPAGTGIEAREAGGSGLARYAFRAMGGPASLQLPGPRNAETDTLAQRAIDEVLRIEARYSRYRADSIVGRINAAAGAAALPCDAETAALLRFADHLWRVSEGRFDATSGVYRRVWDFRGGRLPDAAAVEALRPLVNWSAVHWSDAEVRLPVAGMELDFGGFGKEYAADRAAGVLRSAGVAHALVELAGDLVAIGPRPDGQPWRIGIRHPRDAGALLATVPLADQALATSGDYERCIEVDGRRYGHVLDARTGWPQDLWQSASIVAPTCLAAGAAATLALLMGDGTRAALREGRLRGLFVDRDGAILHT